jgi:hypothetical protein
MRVIPLLVVDESAAVATGPSATNPNATPYASSAARPNEIVLLDLCTEPPMTAARAICAVERRDPLIVGSRVRGLKSV